MTAIIRAGWRNSVTAVDGNSCLADWLNMQLPDGEPADEQ